MWYYNYAIDYWDEGERRFANGIVAGDSNAEAMNKLKEYYSEESIEQVWIQCLTDYCLVFEDEEVDVEDSFKEYLSKMGTIKFKQI